MRPAGWTALLARLRLFGARARVAAETRRELEMHREMLAERYTRAGMTAGDARRAADRQMGNLTMVAEDVYTMNGVAMLDGAARDLRYALRQMRRSPGFSAVVIVTLALGIGGTTAVFSVVHAVLLAPLPYARPGQLVRLYQMEPGKPDTRGVLAATHFSFVRDHAASFEDMAAMSLYSETGADLVREGRARRLRTLRVAGGYFSTLNVPLLIGSGFHRKDESGTRRVVLSEATWRAEFAADPSIVGSTVHLSGVAYEVVGIATGAFVDPLAGNVDAWEPYPLARDLEPENTSLSAVARLRNGVDVERASSELATLSGAMRDKWPGARKSRIVAVPLHEDIVAGARGPLRLLGLAVLLVLVVASVNVANLVLARAAGRVHEFAVRSALGSGRGRLARQLLVESLVLAALGGILGLLLAAGGVALLVRLGQDALPRVGEISFDPVVLAFAALATGATAVACGIVPALHAPEDLIEPRAGDNRRARSRARASPCDAAGARGRPREEPRTFRAGPDGGVRGRRADARDARPLRSAGLRRAAAHA